MAPTPGTAQPIRRQRSHSATVDAWPMRDPADPERMTPEERLQEIVDLFARGILRMRQRRTSAAGSPGLRVSKTDGTCLEFPTETSLDGQCG